MAENRISEGELVTIDHATAASNIAAGRFVAIDTGSNQIYSCDHESVGFSGSALAGARCLGVLDEDVSAGQCPITVWTKGVFKFRINSGSTFSATAMIGHPVFASVSGGGFRVDHTGTTGDVSLGTVVGLPVGTTEPSGSYVRVKINPGAFRWGVYGVQTATVAMYFGNVWPPLT